MSAKATNDLHVHTHVSDGRLSPAATLQQFARAGVQRMVLTDHSAVVWSEALADADRFDVNLLFPGAEISTAQGPRKHHILVYGAALAGDPLPELLRRPNDVKNAVLAEVTDVLRANMSGMPRFEQILDGSAPGVSPTQGKVLASRTAVAHAYATASGVDASSAKFRVDTLAEKARGRRSLEARYPTTVEVLDLANKLGLTACLAHPLWECINTEQVGAVFNDLERFAELGLWGVATRSYHHRPLDDLPALREAATSHGLAIVGGSDFHGNGKVRPGADPTDEDVLDELIAHVASRAPAA